MSINHTLETEIAKMKKRADEAENGAEIKISTMSC